MPLAPHRCSRGAPGAGRVLHRCRHGGRTSRPLASIAAGDVFGASSAGGWPFVSGTVRVGSQAADRERQTTGRITMTLDHAHLGARGKAPLHSSGDASRVDGVAPQSMPNMLPRRALPRGRLAALGVSPRAPGRRVSAVSNRSRLRRAPPRLPRVALAAGGRRAAPRRGLPHDRTGGGREPHQLARARHRRARHRRVRPERQRRPSDGRPRQRRP